MVNAWSLLHDEINGTMDEEYPIMTEKNENYDDFENPNPEQYNFTSSNVTEAKSEKDWQDFWKDDGISITGNPHWSLDGESFSFASTPPTSSPDSISFKSVGPTGFGSSTPVFNYSTSPDPYPTVGSSDQGTVRITGSRLPGAMGEDHIRVDPPKVENTYLPPYYSGNWREIYSTHPQGVDPFAPDLSHVKSSKPPVNLESSSSRKYKEDESIDDLKDYVASTYSGHYTSKNNNVQTLDLIQSVGDAESFCRSNAIKYLSRYDKKGQAKRDILKAMHYCLLLYYFSGQTNEDLTSHGYETF